jgi:hypothetical protein
VPRAGQDDLRLRVRVLRGGLVESVHEVDVCATGPGGEVLSTFDGRSADRPVFLRSAAKPFQALPAVAAGVLERLGLDASHLAVACASHGGTDEHVALVRAVLDRAGLPEAALDCGVTPPLGRPGGAPHGVTRGGARAGPPQLLRQPRPRACPVRGRGLARDGGTSTRGIRSNRPCAPPSTPRSRGPVGRSTRASTAAGWRAYRVELRRLARAYGRLAAGDLGEPGRRTADAMRAHPDLVHGRSGVDSALMAAEEGLWRRSGPRASSPWDWRRTRARAQGPRRRRPGARSRGRGGGAHGTGAGRGERSARGARGGAARQRSRAGRGPSRGRRRHGR